ncbi:hypothetical protein ACOSQ3_016534 [Xanthoceras sorbifolium]
MKVNMDSPGKVVIMLLRYEKLLEYCFECRFIGHSMRKCVHGMRRGDEGGIIVKESPILAAADSNHVVESLEVGFPGLKENGKNLAEEVCFAMPHTSLSFAKEVVVEQGRF